MATGPFIEKPLQSEVPRVNTTRPLALSRPLFELIDQAPSLSPGGPLSWPFSIDATAPYFNSLQMRTLTDSYRKTPNRVALVIGESSLAAALPLIPEETIIALDYVPDMCLFMSRYIATLRTADTPNEWYEHMQDSLPNFEYKYQNMQNNQKNHWNKHGFYHPLTKHGTQRFEEGVKKIREKTEEQKNHEYEENKKAYTKTQMLAREKAIIPWRGDLFNPDDMHQLATALRAQSATITFMNLTNVIAPSTTKAEVEELQVLPTTSDIPILSTSLFTEGYGSDHSYWAKRPRLQQDYGLHVNGPYFGIEALLKALPTTDRSLSSIVTRQYFPKAQ